MAFSIFHLYSSQPSIWSGFTERVETVKGLTDSWKSAIKTLTNLSSIPLSLLSLPSSFAPPPGGDKPYFPRQVNSLLKVSAAQSKAQTKEGKETGEIWGTKELRPYFTEGAAEIAKDENRRGVGGVVHGDFKMDNLVRLFSFTWKNDI
jgi:hypothetical protein